VIGRLAALQQHDDDQEETNHNVDNGQKNKHCIKTLCGKSRPRAVVKPSALTPH
jgi:hypothetical protein